MKTVSSLYLYTNRNVMAFDIDGQQVSEAQGAIDCYHIDIDIARKVCGEATKFYISKWREWNQEISRKEMEYLLGLRTLEMDLRER